MAPRAQTHFETDARPMQSGKQQDPFDPDPLGPQPDLISNPLQFQYKTDAVEEAARQAGARGAAPAGRGPARPEAFRERCKTDTEEQQQDPFDDPKIIFWDRRWYYLLRFNFEDGWRMEG